MPDKSERWGAVMLGACIGFGFVFGDRLGELAWRALLRLYVVITL